MSAIMNASPYENVATQGSRTMAHRARLNALASPTLAAVDATLKAIIRDGKQIFPAGNLTLETEFRRQFESRADVLELTLRIYENALNTEIGEGGGINGALSQIVYAPGKVVFKAGEYGTWAEVYSAFQSLAGVVDIFFDDTGVAPGAPFGMPRFSMPAGTYDFERRANFKARFGPGVTAFVAPDAGTVITNLLSIRDSLGLLNEHAAPIITLVANELFVIFGNAAIASSSGPVILIENQGLLAPSGGGSISIAGGSPPVEVDPGALIIVPMFNTVILDADTFVGDATTTVVFFIDSSVNINLTQTLLLGTVLSIFNQTASLMVYVPALGSDWPASPMVLSEALDYLGNKNVNNKSTALSGAGTFAIGAGSAKLILIDMAAAGAGVANIDLPLPTADGGPWKIKRIDANGAATVNIRGTGGALVDGAASQTLGVTPASANIETDGTNWYRI